MPLCFEESEDLMLKNPFFCRTWFQIKIMSNEHNIKDMFSQPYRTIQLKDLNLKSQKVSWKILLVNK